MRFASGILALSGLVLLAPLAHAEEYVKAYSVTGRATVRVRVDDSNVRVISSDAPKVEFRVTYEGYELGKSLFIESRQEGSDVELTAREKTGLTIGYRNRRVSTEVHVPRDADLQLETGDGAIELAAMNGRISVRSGDGSIRAARLNGTIELTTSDGDIRAEGLKGDVRMRTGDGRVDATGLDGKCSAGSGDGLITLAGRFDSLDVTTGDGGVTARVGAGSAMSGSWHIRSGDGPVELVLPSDFKATVEASTGDGRITMGLPITTQGDLGKSRVRGTLNGGGPALVLRTGDGPIRIHAN